MDLELLNWFGSQWGVIGQWGYIDCLFYEPTQEVQSLIDHCVMSITAE
jgi:hypothetical protein